MPKSKEIAWSNAVMQKGVTRYVCPLHTLNANTGANRALSHLYVDEAGVIDKLQVNIEANGITDNSSLVMCGKNSADASGLQLTIPPSGVGPHYDPTGSVAFATGNQLDWKFVNGANALAADIEPKLISWDFLPNDPTKTVHWGYTGGSGSNLNFSGTRYVMPTGTIGFDASINNAMAKVYGDFRVHSLRFNSSTNARVNGTRVRMVIRHNGLDDFGNLDLTVPAGFVGVTTDLVHEDHLVAGDSYCFVEDTGAGTQTLNSRFCQVTLESTNREWVYYAGNVNTAVFPASGAAQYCALSGNLEQTEAVESLALTKFDFEHRISKLWMYVSANNSNRDFYVGLRVKPSGGSVADTALFKVVSAGATGEIEEVSVSPVTVPANAEACWVIRPVSSGSGSMTMRILTALAATPAPASGGSLLWWNQFGKAAA